MDNKMLIDATHPEETRVVVVRGNRVEEFDFEAANRKQLKGNIYLAKVTRVEPSLQAAFVDYGGNRHGFLAFSEIHPDYYQIPVADRQALLDEEAAAHKESDRDDDEPAEPARKRSRRRRPSAKAAAAKADDAVQSDLVGENGDDESEDAASGDPEIDGNANGEGRDDNHADDDDHDDNEDVLEEDKVESVGSEDAMEEVPERRTRVRAKQFKIQEVIKRRQIILVQVVKEERGNKGAALTTYLSLAGRYAVLMPNTDRGGGISRKITSQADRKRLRSIAEDLDVAEGMGVILRTAGMSRTKTEIKRDFEYLMRLWENVRDLTLKSSAPSLVYEEGSLLKRSIRDLYNKDIDQVLVAGDDSYREAKDFMRMLMPSHAKNVQPYKDMQPIFAKFGVEAQLDAMFSPRVTLKSGGYIVINQTEALVSIDVNSGRSTRENSIEDTALSTNLETAEEVARQLRLRDLAGLIVIDFIDMEENRNNRAVERKLKECLRDDRARIQVGRISHFGLLEMSRQRLRAGVLESTMTPCPHCEGTGAIRAPASIALYVLRAIEDQLNVGSNHHLIVRTKTGVALYVLNHKRAHLSELESRFGLTIRIEADDSIIGEYCVIARGEKSEAPRNAAAITAGSRDIDMQLARDAELDAAAEAEERKLIEFDESGEPGNDNTTHSKAGNAKPVGDREEAGSDGSPRKRRRRRRGGSEAEAAVDGDNAISEEETGEAKPKAEASENGEEAPKRKRRRRGRRGGRRERERNGEATAGNAEGDEAVGQTAMNEDDGGAVAGVEAPEIAADATGASAEDSTAAPESNTESNIGPETESEAAETEKPAALTKRQIAAAERAAAKAEKAAAAEAAKAEAAKVKAEKAAAAKAKKAAKATEMAEPEAIAEEAEPKVEAPAEPVAEMEKPEDAEAKDAKSGRVGWWQRRTFF